MSGMARAVTTDVLGPDYHKFPIYATLISLPILQDICAGASGTPQISWAYLVVCLELLRKVNYPTAINLYQRWNL